MLIQYRSLDPLQTRIDTHRRYSEHPDDVEAAVDRAVALSADAALLDVGCGTGSYLRRLAAAGHAGELVGVDTSEAAIGALRGVSGVTAHLAGAEALPLPDAHFDVVTARHMLYHVSDPVAAIGEARRVLRPGGVFAAVVNIAGATPMLLDLPAEAVAAHGLDPTVFQLPVHSKNLPALVEEVFGHARVERYDNALVFGSPEPVIAYAVSCLTSFGVPADHPLRPAVVDTLVANARALFADGGTRRDPKGYLVATARRND
jgi:SAM-dependent methyltransferase